MTNPIKIHLQFAILSCVCAFGFIFGNSCEAQWNPRQIRAEYDNNTLIQYAPDDPSTRSRLFNLQTGHAGAFYNCDGEEDKRNSPHICWKTANGDRWHRTFWDVLNWRKDKKEIAQRICDGAGACCSSGNCNICNQQQPGSIVHPGVIQETAPTCGCSSCVSKSKAPQTNPRPKSLFQKAVLAASGKDSTQTDLRPQVAPAGLVTIASDVENGANVRAHSVMANGTPEESVSKTAPVSKTASLLDRARSSRQQR